MKLKVYVIDFETPPKVKKWGLGLGIPLGLLLGGGAIAWAAGLHTWSTGDTLNASDLNGNFAQLQSEVTALQQGQVQSGFAAILTNATMIPPGGAFTQVVFNTKAWDLNAEYDVSTGKFSPKQAGLYEVHCEVGISAQAGAVYVITIGHNGNEVNAFDAQATTTGGAFAVAVSALIQMGAGDTLDCSVANGSGSAQPLSLNDRSAFSAARVQ